MSLTESDDRVDGAVCALYVSREEVKQGCGGLLTDTVRHIRAQSVDAGTRSSST